MKNYIAAIAIISSVSTSAIANESFSFDEMNIRSSIGYTTMDYSNTDNKGFNLSVGTDINEYVGTSLRFSYSNGNKNLPSGDGDTTFKTETTTYQLGLMAELGKTFEFGDNQKIKPYIPVGVLVHRDFSQFAEHNHNSTDVLLTTGVGVMYEPVDRFFVSAEALVWSNNAHNDSNGIDQVNFNVGYRF
ncbi:MAG: outer membrane beta-barrel protein [Photobacterium frigidiphilum]|uniref:outer membrane beta-barrel protein n=1 Tax=Photobacterium frigidiphilum TaxID=264736 RepID=UPI003002100F